MGPFSGEALGDQGGLLHHLSARGAGGEGVFCQLSWLTACLLSSVCLSHCWTQGVVTGPHS